jgi:mono/diheme cytochrome c family protein
MTTLRNIDVSLFHKGFIMKILFSFLFIVFSLFAKGDKDIKEGRALYLEANCNKCHKADDKYVPKGTKAKNLKNVKTWVKSCNNYFDSQWFADEEKLVTKYLNSVYFHYKK